MSNLGCSEIWRVCQLKVRETPFSLLGIDAHFIHLEQRLLAHLFQGDDLIRLFVSSEIDLPITTLTHLSDDVELVELEFSTPLSQQYALPAGVGCPFRLFLLRCDIALSDGVTKRG